MISGKVQGVFFRSETKKKAEELGLVGYVENLADGRVKVIAQGSTEDLLSLANWANEGSSMANVRSVDRKFSKPKKIFRDFSITT